MEGKPQSATHHRRADQDYLLEIARLRILVGYLGEKAQHGWWSCEFFSPNSEAFLSPVVGKTANLARYHGVKEAARLVHDGRIGVGRVFHLYRLPESIEQSVFEMLQSAEVTDLLVSEVVSKESAEDRLSAIADSSGPFQEGPLQIGVLADLEDTHWLARAAYCYRRAFDVGSRSFPYLVETG